MVSGAANVAQLKQQGVKQLADEWFQKESLAVDREKIKSAEKLGLEGIDTKIKIAELNAAIKTSIQEGKNEMAEKLMGIRDRMADIAMMNAVTAQGRASRVDGLTANQELNQQRKDEEDAVAIESGVYKGYVLPENVIAAKVAAWNRSHPDDPYVEEEIPGTGTTVFGKQITSPDKRWTRKSEALGTPTPTPTPTTKTFDTLPPASQYKGKTITDTTTGKRFKSDGTKWVEIK